VTQGEIDGVPLGANFSTRVGLYRAGIHRDIRRSICVSSHATVGAESVLIDDRNDDVRDLGKIIYTSGVGSRHPGGRATTDQSMSGANASLAMNVTSGQPVRVVKTRPKGFEYAGLFFVDDAWTRADLSGFLTCRFRLSALPSAGDRGATVPTPASRRLSTTYRMARDGKVATEVKSLYDSTCQICGVRLAIADGVYAEGAHIVPLGGSFAGADHISNVLCLCPNHHAMFDHGGIQVMDDLEVRLRDGQRIAQLTVHPHHGLVMRNFAEHRKIMGFE
jgi:putative restriction endonuclease